MNIYHFFGAVGTWGPIVRGAGVDNCSQPEGIYLNSIIHESYTIDGDGNLYIGLHYRDYLIIDEIDSPPVEILNLENWYNNHSNWNTGGILKINKDARAKITKTKESPAIKS